MRWKLFWLTVVTGGVEPQKGSVITQACIADPKVYPGIPMVFVLGRTVMTTGGHFVKKKIVDIGFFLRFQHKNHPKFKKPPNMHKKCKNVDFINFFYLSNLTLWTPQTS